jgi:phosphoglycolate phosphatase
MKHVIFDCDGTLVDTSQSPFRLFPGIQELILKLSGECMLYVWTGRDRPSTHRILKENGLLASFEALYTSNDGPTKPHTYGLECLVPKVPKESICIIGDSPADMLGGRNFGVLCLGAVWNRQVNGIHLSEAGADFLVSHPDDCSKIIQQNLKGVSNV